MQYPVGITTFKASRVRTDIDEATSEPIAIEQPLEVILRGHTGTEAYRRVIAVTMRTPGHDAELSLGFLFTEGLIATPAAVVSVEAEGNRVEVELRHGEPVDLARLERHTFISSSCGVCGKKSIAAVHVQQRCAIPFATPVIHVEVLQRLPEYLRAAQRVFAATGGTHASALFTAEGALVNVREDVGRHNALDKLVGSQFVEDAVPLSQHVLLVSGRASFELVQKAAVAGIPVVAAVGAPSSLAIELARDRGMTLVGFLREGRFNVYAGAERLK